MVGRSALGYSALGYSVLVLGAREERDQDRKKKWFFKGCLKQTSGFVRKLFNSGFQFTGQGCLGALMWTLKPVNLVGLWCVIDNVNENMDRFNLFSFQI